MTNLTNVKSTLEHFTNAIEQLVRLLPEHGDVESDCQRLTMINALYNFEDTISGLEDSDLNFENSYNPCMEQDFQRFNSLAHLKLKAIDLYIKKDDKGDNQTIRPILGHQIMATLNDTIHFDLEDESLLESLDENLEYQVSQGFREGQFEFFFGEACTSINWSL